jgi:hypothetical protein
MGVQNALRSLVNIYAAENAELSKKANELSVRAFCLREAEQRLKIMTQEPNLNVRKLAKLAKENNRIVEEKKKIVRQDIMADLMKKVMKADKDESGEFDDNEIKRLLRYVKSVPSITVNERKFTKAVKKERSLNAVLELVHDIARDDIPDNKRIFVINDDELILKPQENTTQKGQKTARTLSPKRERKTAHSPARNKTSTTPKLGSVVEEPKKPKSKNNNAASGEDVSLAKSKKEKKKANPTPEELSPKKPKGKKTINPEAGIEKSPKKTKIKKK